jgi:flagellar protein FlaF
MGFSVSGAAAIIFVSLFIGFGMMHTAAANSYERVADAEAARTDRVLEQQNTAVEIVTATHNGTHLTVEAKNAGASQLRLPTSDLLVDGRYETGWATGATVAGYGDSDLWLSGETVSITVSASTQPDHVTVVTESGISATREVTPV